ncbi:MAG: molybdopterin-guanine dinucleotide biosynthesis protein B [Firmicutes bacterium]|nr:molybdopterin-guanine dinucleotide biosynthesis protein B [Bacillota bacterium]
MPKIIGISGWSGAGKTTLIERLIPVLHEKGIRTAVIKHDVHGIDEDDRGKDSARFRDAGARQCVLCGPEGPSFDEALEAIEDVDLVLVEGFKDVNITQIGIARKESGKGFAAPLSRYIALVTDLDVEAPVIKFGTDNIEDIADYIISVISLRNEDC